jgi:hypothetical protein
MVVAEKRSRAAKEKAAVVVNRRPFTSPPIRLHHRIRRRHSPTRQLEQQAAKDEPAEAQGEQRCD